MLTTSDFRIRYARMCSAFGRPLPPEVHLQARFDLMREMGPMNYDRAFRLMAAESGYPGQGRYSAILRACRLPPTPAGAQPIPEPARLEYRQFRWKLLVMTLSGLQPREVAAQLRSWDGPEVSPEEIAEWEAKSDWKDAPITRVRREPPVPLREVLLESVCTLIQKLAR